MSLFTLLSASCHLNCVNATWKWSIFQSSSQSRYQANINCGNQLQEITSSITNFFRWMYCSVLHPSQPILSVSPPPSLHIKLGTVSRIVQHIIFLHLSLEDDVNLALGIVRKEHHAHPFEGWTCSWISASQDFLTGLTQRGWLSFIYRHSNCCSHSWSDSIILLRGMYGAFWKSLCIFAPIWSFLGNLSFPDH